MTAFSLNTDVRDDGVTRVALGGEFDLSVAPRVEDELARAEAAQPAVLILDLRELSFMDSSGLRIVVTAHERAQKQGRRLIVVNGPDPVRRVFEITKVNEAIELVDDPADVVVAG